MLGLILLFLIEQLYFAYFVTTFETADALRKSFPGWQITIPVIRIRMYCIYWNYIWMHFLIFARVGVGKCNGK